MISTRRIVAAVGLAAGVTGLAAPLAHAAPASARDTGMISPMATLDSLAVSGVPVEHRGELPRVSEQLQGLNGLQDLGELHQVTDLVAPVTGLLPAVES
ncbi:hypothetical protein ABZ922_22235 [Streptomyces shenzhenensis]|uniref:hypothetical protein n=1 Tax=Streptomyces shenzhenensis TaxID=943815 RepID=UPI00340B6997